MYLRFEVRRIMIRSKPVCWRIINWSESHFGHLIRCEYKRSDPGSVFEKHQENYYFYWIAGIA